LISFELGGGSNTAHTEAHTECGKLEDTQNKGLSNSKTKKEKKNILCVLRRMTQPLCVEKKIVNFPVKPH